MFAIAAPRSPSRKKLLALLLGISLATPPVWAETVTVRVAVVGGLVLCDVWPRLAKKAEQALGLRVETVAASPKEGVVPAFATGQADLLLIHGSDAANALLAAGIAAPLRAWALNEHVIVGPPDDPAKVREAPNGAEAVRRIAASGASFVAFRDPGSHAVVSALWRSAGIRPGQWVIPDTSDTAQGILGLAAEKGAYTVVGHIPVAFGKMPAAGSEVLLNGDPEMRRVYVVIEPGPRHPATAEQRAAARELADYLLSPVGQADLRTVDREAGGPWIYTLP
ncbi:tungsten ABC transporter permease [Dechloromonas sp. ARDL1]|uniref:tungsten ABC transporter permease n=1 Tax=Dechloromonas sp. ARDL1 TaxID=3322121 RepID=UPI003DA79F8C